MGLRSLRWIPGGIKVDFRVDTRWEDMGQGLEHQMPFLGDRWAGGKVEDDTGEAQRWHFASSTSISAMPLLLPLTLLLLLPLLLPS